LVAALNRPLILRILSNNGACGARPAAVCRSGHSTLTHIKGFRPIDSDQCADCSEAAIKDHATPFLKQLTALSQTKQEMNTSWNESTYSIASIETCTVS
jgi:hypothetical protein